MSSKQKIDPNIAVNRKALYEYFIEARYEAGIMLQGWEVKSLRAGRAQIDQSYVIIKNNEAWLLGADINPLLSASSHIQPESQRTRKLLLKQKELNQLIGHVERKGFTLIPLKLYWKDNFVKLEIGLAKGKKLYDKRAAAKERDWKKDKQRLLKTARANG